MFTLANADCPGVNIETGVNQLGFVSSYSPIGDDEHGRYAPEPDCYGVLAVAQASRGDRIHLDYDASGANLTAYAVLGDDNRLSVILINKDFGRGADVAMHVTSHFARGNILRLSAPGLESKNGVTLGNAAVGSDGEWKPEALESMGPKRGHRELHVPAGSAAIVKFAA